MQRLHQMTNEGLARMGESLLLRRRGWWRCMMAVLVCIGVLCSSVMSPVEAEAVPNDTLVSKLGGTVSTVSPRGTTIDLFDYSDSGAENINTDHVFRFGNGNGWGIPIM